MSWWMIIWAVVALLLVGLVGWSHDRDRQRGAKPSGRETAFWFVAALAWPLPAALLILSMAIDLAGYLLSVAKKPH